MVASQNRQVCRETRKVEQVVVVVGGTPLARHAFAGGQGLAPPPLFRKTSYCARTGSVRLPQTLSTAFPTTSKYSSR